MRKQVLFGAALLALGTAVVSCSKDEVVVDNTPGVETPVAEGEQEIILQVANTGDGLETRAGRPLFSSEAKQSIDKVKVVIVQTSTSVNEEDDKYSDIFSNNGKIVATQVFDNWSTDAVSQVYNTDGHGRKATWKLKNNTLAKSSTFRVYAVGYTSTGSLYSNGVQNFENLNSSTSNDFSLFTNKLSDFAKGLGEEIFAGEIAELKTDANGSFDLTLNSTNNVLTLHRQVAGAMGYFTSIPLFKLGLEYTQVSSDDIENYSLRLVSSNLSNEIVLANFNSKFTETDPDATNEELWESLMFVVNGKLTDIPAGSEKYYTDADFSSSLDNYGKVFEIKLNEWFPNGDTNNDGLLNEEDITNENDWDTPSSVQGASFKPGSVFAGTFLIPFAKIANRNTLQLQLIKNEGSSDNVLRVWNINLPSNDAQIYPDAGHASVWNGYTNETGPENLIAFPANSVSENAQSYSMVRNHLYTIGSKTSDSYNPENPDTDEPEDLSKGQNLILKVNDNWELIHKMEIE